MTFVVRFTRREDEAGQVLADLLDFDISGVEQDEQGGRVWFAVYLKDRPPALAIAERFNGELSELPDENWAESWQSQWQPLLAGERFYLSPPWLDDSTPPGRIRIDMQPGLVFGSGDHPTTRLCVSLLERYVTPGSVVADIGCGSGILSLVAQHLGAARICACDLECDAVTATRTLLPRAAVWQGSVAALRTGAADVVAANLLTNIVTALMPEFHRVLKPGATLVASGFLDTQANQVHHHGFERLELLTQAGWAAAAFRKL